MKRRLVFLGSIALLALAAALIAAPASATTVTWINSGSSTWDTTTPNWSGGGGYYADGNDVVFGNVITSDATVTVSPSAVAPASVTIYNPTHNYTFSGADINAASVEVNGIVHTSTVTFNNNLNVSGTFNVDSNSSPGPYIVFNGTNNLGTLSATQSQLTFTGANTIGTFIVHSSSYGTGYPTTTGLLTVNTLIELHGSNAFDANNSGITGTAGLLCVENTTVLYGTLAYTGTTTIQGGSIRLATSAYGGFHGNLPSTTALTINGGSLDMYGHSQTVASLSGSGGELALDGGTCTVGDSTNTTFGGAVTSSGLHTSGAGSNGSESYLIKQGSGTLTLTGTTANYVGRIGLMSGTLKLVGSDAYYSSIYGMSDAGKASAVDVRVGTKVMFNYSGGTSPAMDVYNDLKDGNDWGFALNDNDHLCSSNAVSSGMTLGWKDDGSTVTVMATVFGDANLDGSCDSGDLGIVLAHYNHTGYWYQGDFNYDGTVDGTDLGVVLGHLNTSASALSAVPEPSSLLLTFAGLMGLLAYAWRKRK